MSKHLSFSDKRALTEKTLAILRETRANRNPVPDSIGPDPFTIKDGFKKLPTYECSLCGDRHTSENLKDAQNHDPSTGEWLDKQLCLECVNLVDTQWDWRVW